MSRTLSVSTAVFAAIWAERREGEETEDAILRRLLKCGSNNETVPREVSPAGAGTGVYDVRNSVHFEEGFEIFRSYKGREYRATASGGSWLRRDNDQRYPTLNQLNASIAAGAENVWNGNWKFRRSDGVARSISELRR